MAWRDEDEAESLGIEEVTIPDWSTGTGWMSAPARRKIERASDSRDPPSQPWSPCHQQGGQHVERILRAQRDDDLVGIGEDAARGRRRACGSARSAAGRRDRPCRTPVADFEHRQRHAVALAPLGGREQRRVELAVDEGIGRLDPVLVLGRRRHVAGGDLPACLPVDLVGLVGRLLVRLGRRRQTSGLTKWPRRSRATRKPWSTSCWKASTTVPRATPSFSARIRHDGSGIEAAIWRSRIAATMAWRICACRVWPDSAEIRNRPDHIAVSFRCGMKDVLDGQLFSLGWTSGM